jgi:catechol 2,3-dioxygenase-like lactoylglutathione lyase family enzyme
MKKIWMACLLLAWLGQTFAQKVSKVEAVSITVADIDSEIIFFEQVLSFKKTDDVTLTGDSLRNLYNLPESHQQLRVATLKLGEEQIKLLDFDPYSKSNPQQMAFNAGTRGNDLWFQHLAIVVSDMDSAYQRLLKNKVTHVSTAPQTLPTYLVNAAGIRAFYFRDPEGHNLELIWFPPGKGNPKWSVQSSDVLFKGIDHTAISISDTDQSMSFYRDQLGLKHLGHSENYGTEQEHLNQVFGARLDINGLGAAEGFGVEFLRYIAPPGGRMAPVESHPTDLWHYQTELRVADFDGMILRLKKAGCQLVSKGNSYLSGTRQCLLRDPDGHAILLKG